MSISILPSIRRIRPEKRFNVKKRNLGGLEVSEISLGCMGMTHAYGSPADKKEMTGLIRTAYDAGYTIPS
jgi:hypothetical protein